MWVHVGHKFIHAKFHDPDDDRRADMAKKNNFLIFRRFMGVFCKKMVPRIQTGTQNFV